MLEKVATFVCNGICECQYGIALLEVALWDRVKETEDGPLARIYNAVAFPSSNNTTLFAYSLQHRRGEFECGG